MDPPPFSVIEDVVLEVLAVINLGFLLLELGSLLGGKGIVSSIQDFYKYTE